jgi:hypothetical protein
VGERRTRPVEGLAAAAAGGPRSGEAAAATGAHGRAAVSVEMEGVTVAEKGMPGEVGESDVMRKPKKRVAFRTDRPDVYDF